MDLEDALNFMKENPFIQLFGSDHKLYHYFNGFFMVLCEYPDENHEGTPSYTQIPKLPQNITFIKNNSIAK